MPVPELWKNYVDTILPWWWVYWATLVALMRRVIEREVPPVEAVKAYHARLQEMGIPSRRSLDQDLELTSTFANY